MPEPCSPDAIPILRVGSIKSSIIRGGYVASKKELINYLKNASRGYMFSAALPPAQVAAANEAFKVILDESWRVEKLRHNADQFINGLKSAGFDTMLTT